MKYKVPLAVALLACAQLAARATTVSQWEVFETSYGTTRTYASPFVDVEVNVVFSTETKRWVMPAFWAGSGKWTVRFAPPAEGVFHYRVECTDQSNPDLNGREQTIRVEAYHGNQPLRKHGFLRISADRRHFEHADGTPFLWLGDTWWKGLCKRLTWEGFQELAADRQAKGFSVVQIVCGVYPDEGLFEPRWENEGGKPYKTRDFSIVNPEYFNCADRRIKHLVEKGMVPAIVGGWGRGDCDGMRMAGVAGIKRHWRNLIAHFGAYPTIWIVGGESGGPQWTEVARYVRQTDPYHRPTTIHPFNSARQSVTDETVIDFDMLQTGHGDWIAAIATPPKVRAAYDRTPPMPVVIGECCYEGHMQTAFQDVQRYLFWTNMLSGSAGHTYGAAGVWHASVEGDPGITPIYDWTTWKEGMNAPGSNQLGLGKKLLERYPWWRFTPHPDWVEPGCFAAGVPGEVRLFYVPRRGIYNWNGIAVKKLERDVAYHAFYFNPTNGKQYDLGQVVNAGPPPKPFEGHTAPLLFEDHFQGANRGAWKDHGTPTERKNGRLVGRKGMVTVLEQPSETNLMASIDARSDAEAGIILRFHDPDHYVVGLYSPLLKSLFIHDRKNGQWGANLGEVAVPEIGPNIRITAAVHGANAALVLTDGIRSYWTPVVEVTNTAAGKTGLWLYQIGDHQEYGDFTLSRTPLAAPGPGAASSIAASSIHQTRVTRLTTDQYKTPSVPSPQDWVLVLERVRK